jgi:hypothetical protein
MFTPILNRFTHSLHSLSHSLTQSLDSLMRIPFLNRATLTLFTPRRYHTCIDRVAWDFQHDFGSVKTPVCGPEPVGDVVVISKRLLEKYV